MADAPLLVFALHEARFAVRGQAVRKAVRTAVIASLPDASEVVEGVVNDRAQIVPAPGTQRREDGR